MIPSILCDAVKTVAVHNGVARVVLMRLDADGQSFPVLELQIPVPQVADVVKALASIRRPQ